MGPLGWVLVASGLLRAVGIGWGLPASDGWDNDGIAPRDFLAGLVETFTPGHHFTYPPFHLLLLGLVTSPATIVALARAHSTAPHDVVAEIIKVPYMTVIAFVARAVCLAMSVGLTWAVAKMAEELRGPRAGVCAAAACAVSATLAYYAKTTNLDVPYLFWGSLALLAWMRAVRRGELRQLRRALALAAVAVATKDQAYGLFLVALPASLVAWLALDRTARAAWPAIAKELAIGLATAVALLLVLDAVVFNPTGFAARVRFLLGPASRDFAQYSSDAAGRAAVVTDLAGRFDQFYPMAFVALLAGGLVIAVRRRETAAAGLVPLLAAASFTLTFNMTALRSEHRFALPHMTLAAVYIGLGVDALVVDLRGRFARLTAQAALAVAFAVGIWNVLDVDANLVLDPRYDAEAWLAAHAAAGDTVEVHGLNVYLPRFPDTLRVTRVGPDPVDRRNPLPGVTELQDRYDDIGAAARRPRWVVVCRAFAWRYLDNPRDRNEHGLITPPTQVKTETDPDGTQFFRELFYGNRGYHVAHLAAWHSKLWPPVDIHASTSREVWIFERNGGS